ncbi:MAG: DUF308 domain-containing protein, partial [Methanobrevibacter wolinii]
IGILGIIAAFGGIGKALGATSLILGIVYFIVGYYVADPKICGFLIGLWLLITGIVGILRN